MRPCPPSTLRASSKRATRSSRAGLRQARSWNCCATASAMIAWSPINPGNSSWSRPGFPLGNYELTLRSRQPNGKQAISEQSVMVALDKADRRTPRASAFARRGEVRCSGDRGGKPTARRVTAASRRRFSAGPWGVARRGRVRDRTRPRSFPAATACGASAESLTARACDTPSFTEPTGTRSEIRI